MLIVDLGPLDDPIAWVEGLTLHLPTVLPVWSCDDDEVIVAVAATADGVTVTIIVSRAELVDYFNEFSMTTPTLFYRVIRTTAMSAVDTR